MRAVRLLEPQSHPQVVDVDEPDPRPGEVVIDVGGAGLCHSDLHLMEWPAEAVEDLFDLPFTLGHENAGTVSAVGDGVTDVEVGQSVAVYGPWGCGHCHRCRQGHEQYCDNAEEVGAAGGGLGRDGGLASKMLVPDQRLLVPLPDGLDPKDAAPLSDAGLTPYSAVARLAHRMGPRTHTLCIGVGGLGQAGVRLAAEMTASTITAVDLDVDRLATAAALGAHHTVEAGDAAAEAVLGHTGGRGVDVVLDFVGNDATLALAMEVVRARSEVMVVGIGGGTVPFTFMEVPYGLSLSTTYWGSQHELVELLDLAARGLVPIETEHVTLDEVPATYERLERGEVTGRAVALPNG